MKKYMKEYNEANFERAKFIELVKKNYPHLSDSSVMRRFYECRQHKNDIPFETIEKPKKKTKKLKPHMEKYKVIYDVTGNKNDFISLMEMQYKNLRKTTIKKYYNDLRRKVGEQKEIPKELSKIKKSFTEVIKPKKKIEVIEDIYLNEDKKPLDMMKKILWNDVKQMGHDKKSRRYLNKFFTNAEINWLIDQGEYSDPMVVKHRKYIKERQNE